MPTLNDRMMNLTRRDWLKIGLAGFSLPQLLRLRAVAGPESPRERTAIIALCCHGGISHIDTWDPKTLAPAEIRGEFRTIDTSVPGMQLPRSCPRTPRSPTNSACCGPSHIPGNVTRTDRRNYGRGITLISSRGTPNIPTSSRS